MEKIAIIGSPGSGKTTLAKHLGLILKIKVYHLDRLFWKPDWRPVDKETRVDTMQALIREKQWIIEGTYLSSSLPRLNEADTIIFLDISPSVCLWRVTKRHYKDNEHPRSDIPDGSVDKLTARRMLKVLSFPFRGRKILLQKLCQYDSKQIIWLRSNKDVEDFLRTVRKHYVNEGINFSLIPSLRSIRPNLLPN